MTDEDRKAMERALEALEPISLYKAYNGDDWPARQVVPVIDTLRARLAQPEQRPRVCCKDTDSDGLPRTLTCDPRCFRASPPPQPERKPDGYAYRYHSQLSDGTTIRFNEGQEVNGSKPIEAVPYYFGHPPQPEQRPEPVAWVEHHKGGDNLCWDDPGGKRTPLYASPPARDQSAALAIVHEQAEDEGLWFIAATAPEAYLQQALRRLHTAVEAAPVRARRPA